MRTPPPLSSTVSLGAALKTIFLAQKSSTSSKKAPHALESIFSNVYARAPLVLFHPRRRRERHRDDEAKKPRVEETGGGGNFLLVTSSRDDDDDDFSRASVEDDGKSVFCFFFDV